MPVNVQEVRIKLANRQRITTEELEALIAAEGWFMGRMRLRMANGFKILYGEAETDDPTHQRTPYIEVTTGRIRIVNAGGDRQMYRDAAQLAAAMWGAGGTVLVKGDRHLREACRAAGLTVINNNPSARAWRALTRRQVRAPARPPGAGAGRPAAGLHARAA